MQHGAYLHFSQVLLIVFFDVGSVQTSSVDELNLPIFVLDPRTDRISGGVRSFRNHHFVFAKDLIDKCRLTDIGPSDETNFDDVLHPDVFDLCSSGIRKAFFWLDQKIFVIVLIEILIFFRIWIDFPKIIFPFLYLKIFAAVVTLDIFLKFFHQFLESFQPQFPSRLMSFLDTCRNGVIDKI